MVLSVVPSLLSRRWTRCFSLLCVASCSANSRAYRVCRTSSEVVILSTFSSISLGSGPCAATCRTTTGITPLWFYFLKISYHAIFRHILWVSDIYKYIICHVGDHRTNVTDDGGKDQHTHLEDNKTTSSSIKISKYLSNPGTLTWWSVESFKGLLSYYF